MPYLTPDTIPTNTKCRYIVIPDDLRIVGAVSGALLELTYERNWEAYGAVTPAAAAAAMIDIVVPFMDSDCEDLMSKVDVWRHEQDQGTNGGGITANTLTKVPFNSVMSPISGYTSTPSGDSIFRILPGLYLLHVDYQMRAPSGYIVLRWKQQAGYQDLTFDVFSSNTPNGGAIAFDVIFQNPTDSLWGLWVQVANTVAASFFFPE